MVFYLKEKAVLFPQSCLDSCMYECWWFIEDCAQSQCWAEHRQCLLFSRLCRHRSNLFLAGYHIKAEIWALLMPFAISPRSRAERFYDRTQLKDLQDPKPECLDRMRVNRESRLLQFGERLGQDSTFSWGCIYKKHFLRSRFRKDCGKVA